MTCSLDYDSIHLSQAPNLSFQPSLESDSPDSFQSLVESLLDDVFNFASLVPRVAKHNDMPHYHSDVEEVRECVGLTRLDFLDISEVWVIFSIEHSSKNKPNNDTPFYCSECVVHVFAVLLFFPFFLCSKQRL